MSTSDKELRCRNCGAPLEVSPETIAIVCSYCSYLNWIREDIKDEVLVVKPLRDKDILEKVRGFVSRQGLGDVFSPSNLSKSVTILAPFYFVDVSAEADYNGIVAVDIRRCVGSRNQKKCWTETHKVRVSGVYGPTKDVIPISGRRGADVLSIKALAYRYKKNKVDATSLAALELDKGIWKNILSIEIDRKTALDIAIDSHLDIVRKTIETTMRREAERRASARGTVVSSRIIWKRITPRNVKAVTSPPILLPMCILTYKYGDEVYRAVVCGWDGDVMVLERPMKKMDRILWGTAAALSSGVSGGLAASMLVAGSDVGIGVGILLILIGGYLSWYCVRKAIAPVKSSLIGSSIRELKKYSESPGLDEKVRKLIDSIRIAPM